MHNLTNAFVIYGLVTNDPRVTDRQIFFYSSELSMEFIITLGVLCILNLLGLIFLIDLIKFHIELKMKGLSTYEFLKLKEKVSRESKIVIKVNQELRDELQQEEFSRAKVKGEQEKLRKILAEEEVRKLYK